MQTQSGTRLTMLDSFHYLYPIKINTIFIRFPGRFAGSVQTLRNIFWKTSRKTYTNFEIIFKIYVIFERYVTFERPPKRNVRIEGIDGVGREKQAIHQREHERWNMKWQLFWSVGKPGEPVTWRVGGILKAFFLPPPYFCGRFVPEIDNDLLP